MVKKKDDWITYVGIVTGIAIVTWFGFSGIFISITLIFIIAIIIYIIQRVMKKKRKQVAKKK